MDSVLNSSKCISPSKTAREPGTSRKFLCFIQQKNVKESKTPRLDDRTFVDATSRSGQKGADAG